MTTKTVNGQTVYIYSNEELRIFVDNVLNHGRGVSDWEQQFMKDMQKRDRYSEKQAEVIARIYAQRT